MLQWKLETNGVSSDWEAVEQGNSFQFGTSPQWNYNFNDGQNTQQHAFTEDSEQYDLKFRFSPSAEGKTATWADDFEQYDVNGDIVGYNANLFGLSIKPSQSTVEDLK